jgi:hypothetical protein
MSRKDNQMNNPIDQPLTQSEMDDLISHLAIHFSEVEEIGIDEHLAEGTLDALASDFMAFYNAIVNHNSPLPTIFRS